MEGEVVKEEEKNKNTIYIYINQHTQTQQIARKICGKGR